MIKQVVQPTGRSKAVGIWIRVSTEDQARGESPEHHERRARYYAESKGWEIKEIYHLEAVSGKSVMDHPETKRMLRDIKSRHITGLIFSKLARLARNTRELLDFADTFREDDADLVSLQESIDTSSPAGRLFYTMIAAMAQWEREEIAERVAASVPVRARLGKSLGGQAPFGYQWVDKKLIPHPQEGPVRKLMYQLFSEHKRKRTVARLLNTAGHRTRNGSNFNDRTVDRLLRDPTAKGVHRSNYTKAVSKGKQWSYKPESDWVLNEVEAVVSPELWDQCNSILEGRRKDGKRPARKAVNLFAGLAFCACGSKMYVPSNSPKYICFACRNKIPVIDLEGVFHEQLKAFFLSPQDIASYLDEADNTIKEKQELLQALQRDQQKIITEMDKIMRLYLDDKLGPDGFAKEYRPLEEREKQLSDQIPELQGEIDFLRVSFLSSDQIITEAASLYTRWPELDQAEKRQIIENVTERVTVGDSEVSIDLVYLPSSSKVLASEPRNVRDSLPPRA